MTVWDNNKDVVIPKEIYSYDANTIIVTFSSALEGYINVAKGGHFVSGSVNYTNVGTDIVPSFTNVYDLGTPSKQWRHLNLSSGSIYMNGIQILSLNQDNQVVIGGTVVNTIGSTGTTYNSGSMVITGDLEVQGALTASSFQLSSLIKIGNSQIGSISQVVSGTTSMFNLSSFDGANFDYLVKSGSNRRAGNIAAVWDGSNVSFNETNTTDLGDTSTITFNVDIMGSLVAYVSSGTWTVEAMYRALGNL